MSRRGEIAGALSQRVRFERRTERQGTAGEWAGEWVPVAERWAAVELLSRITQSARVADTRHSARRWRIRVRSDVELEIGMRAVWQGLELRISGVENDPLTPDEMAVIAEEFAL